MGATFCLHNESDNCKISSWRLVPVLLPHRFAQIIDSTSKAVPSKAVPRLQERFRIQNQWPCVPRQKARPANTPLCSCRHTLSSSGPSWEGSLNAEKFSQALRACPGLDATLTDLRRTASVGPSIHPGPEHVCVHRESVERPRNRSGFRKLVL